MGGLSSTPLKMPKRSLFSQKHHLALKRGRKNYPTHNAFCIRANPIHVYLEHLNSKEYPPLQHRSLEAARTPQKASFNHSLSGAVTRKHPLSSGAIYTQSSRAGCRLRDKQDGESTTEGPIEDVEGWGCFYCYLLAQLSLQGV